MTIFRVLAIVPAALACLSATAEARPHCFADVTVSDGTRTATANRTWDNRQNGGRWNQSSGNHRAECGSLGTNHIAGLDLVAVAQANGLCGTITAQGTGWIGTSKRRTPLGPRSVTVECAAASEPEPDFQYASKVLCGQGDERLARNGDYRAVVNVHNPGYGTVDFRYKLATAEPATDGKISTFTDSVIGPDGAQYFTCDQMAGLNDGNPDFDGFFVIESREPLGIVTYYTGGTDAVTSLDVETTREREIEGDREWSCGQASANLATVAGWTLNGQPPVVRTDVSPYRTDGISLWLSDRATGDSPGTAFSYRLPFCLCDGVEGYDNSASITVSALRGDNTVQANVDGAPPFVAGQNTHLAVPAGSGSITVTQPGTHVLEFLATNQRNTQHAIGFSGSITISNGYLGQCR